MSAEKPTIPWSRALTTDGNSSPNPTSHSITSPADRPTIPWDQALVSVQSPTTVEAKPISVAPSSPKPEELNALGSRELQRSTTEIELEGQRFSLTEVELHQEHTEDRFEMGALNGKYPYIAVADGASSSIIGGQEYSDVSGPTAQFVIDAFKQSLERALAEEPSLELLFVQLKQAIAQINQQVIELRKKAENLIQSGIPVEELPPDTLLGATTLLTSFIYAKDGQKFWINCSVGNGFVIRWNTMMRDAQGYLLQQDMSPQQFSGAGGTAMFPNSNTSYLQSGITIQPFFPGDGVLLSSDGIGVLKKVALKRELYLANLIEPCLKGDKKWDEECYAQGQEKWSYSDDAELMIIQSKS